MLQQYSQMHAPRSMHGQLNQFVVEYAYSVSLFEGARKIKMMFLM